METRVADRKPWSMSVPAPSEEWKKADPKPVIGLYDGVKVGAKALLNAEVLQLSWKL